MNFPCPTKLNFVKKTNVNLFESCSQLKPSTLSPLRPFGGPNLELSEAPEKPSGALGEPHELQATEMQWGPLKCFVNRRKRHSRATSSQMYSANTFVDFPIAQTLEDLNSLPVAASRRRAARFASTHAARLLTEFAPNKCHPFGMLC